MPRDAVVGAVVLAVAGFYWWAARTIRHSSLDDPIGAAGVPNTLAAVLAGLAVLLILRSLVLRSRATESRRDVRSDEAPRAPGLVVEDDFRPVGERVPAVTTQVEMDAAERRRDPAFDVGDGKRVAAQVEIEHLVQQYRRARALEREQPSQHGIGVPFGRHVRAVHRRGDAPVPLLRWPRAQRRLRDAGIDPLLMQVPK